MPADVDLLSIHNPPELIGQRTALIREEIGRRSAHLREPNFRVIGSEDLKLLFELYDLHFFAGGLAAKLAQVNAPIGFRVSSTMTRSGGKTIRRRSRLPDARARDIYEIAIGARLLFMTFGRIDRPVSVSGLSCRDRLDALMRTFEHELIHLAEMLAWDASSCSGARFKAMARNIFGHTGTKHELVTPREHAAAEHNVRIGAMVEFGWDGRTLVGRVNRISRRATVLVESPGGWRYSDGRHYEKFLVPLELLKVLG